MGGKTGLAAVVVLAFATPALAAGNPFLGVWHVVSAKPAPWSGPQAKAAVDPGLAHRGMIKIGDIEVYGPKSVACRSVKYNLAKVAPDALFGGSLKDPTTDAAALGFTRDPIVTLEANCAGRGVDSDYAMVNHRTVLLNVGNVLYTLKR